MWRICALFLSLWRGLRALAGDDAYERFLAHRDRCHPDAPHAAGGSPMTRAEFYRREQERKWNRPQRCC